MSLFDFMLRYFSRKAADRIGKVNRNMKLLLITRDPTKRLVSDYTASLNEYTGKGLFTTTNNEREDDGFRFCWHLAYINPLCGPLSLACDSDGHFNLWRIFVLLVLCLDHWHFIWKRWSFLIFWRTFVLYWFFVAGIFLSPFTFQAAAVALLLFF